MKQACLALALLFPLAAFAQAEPDYAVWNHLLAKYYDPARGMDYRALKANDAVTLETLRRALGRVNAGTLTPKQQLAYWINVYNINTAATIVEHYPVDSIRDISTDPLIRLNVFKKPRVPTPGGLISLDDVEHEKIRKPFRDARIHFAINCAARSCPPIREEAFTGTRVDAQLDDQTRKFMAGPLAPRFRRNGKGNKLEITTTKIMDWFGEDFGDRAAFIRRYVTPDRQRLIDGAREIDLDYADYDWALNDWRR